MIPSMHMRLKAGTITLSRTHLMVGMRCYGVLSLVRLLKAIHDNVPDLMLRDKHLASPTQEASDKDLLSATSMWTPALSDRN